MKSLPFLWEIGCEEIPAGWLPGLLEQLKSRVLRASSKRPGWVKLPVEVYGTLATARGACAQASRQATEPP